MEALLKLLTQLTGGHISMPQLLALLPILAPIVPDLLDGGELSPENRLNIQEALRGAELGAGL
jgi:hypothetical protein